MQSSGPAEDGYSSESDSPPSLCAGSEDLDGYGSESSEEAEVRFVDRPAAHEAAAPAAPEAAAPADVDIDPAPEVAAPAEEGLGDGLV
jgi:hypothetical protein